MPARLGEGQTTNYEQINMQCVTASYSQATGSRRIAEQGKLGGTGSRERPATRIVNHSVSHLNDANPAYDDSALQYNTINFVIQFKAPACRYVHSVESFVSAWKI